MLYYESKSGQEAIDLPALKKRKQGPDNQPTKYYNALGEVIHSWHNQTYKDDPFHVTYSSSIIIDVDNIKKLVTVHPKCLKSADDITSILGESEEWSDIYGWSLFEIIQRFDKEIEAMEKAEREREREREREGESGFEE